MATHYVDSAATGLNDGTSWADAYTTLVAAFAAGSAGDVFYLKNTHDESSGADWGITSPGTPSNPCVLISMNSSDVYTKATAKQLWTTGSGDYIRFYGVCVCHGLFTSSGSSTFNREGWRFYDSTVEFGRVSAGLHVPGNTTATRWRKEYINTTIKGVTTGAVYAVFTLDSNDEGDSLLVEGCTLDISSAASIDSLVHSSTVKTPHPIIFRNMALDGVTDKIMHASMTEERVRLERCVLEFGVVIAPTYNTTYDGEMVLESCDVGDGYHFFHYGNKYGQFEEDTGIYRDAGATYDGTNEFSAEIITTSLASFYTPFRQKLASFYVDTDDFTTDITFKVHLARDDSTTAFNDDEVWIEVEYNDGADNALGVVASSRPDPGAAGIALTSESVAWTGLTGSFKKMSISKTITIGVSAGNIASGAVRVNVCVAKASQTLYVCPKVELS